MTVTFSKTVEINQEGNPIVYEQGKTYTAGSGFEQAVFRTALVDGRAKESKTEQTRSNKILSPTGVK